MEPFLWVAVFVLCALVHLVAHPLARTFRDGLRWCGQHPAPFLWLLATHMVYAAWTLRAGSEPPPGEVSSLSPWPEAFLDCAAGGWQRFALLFHQAIVPPPLFAGSIPGSLFMGLVSATGQMWLCCYMMASRKTLMADPAFQQTVARWRIILPLALCHAAWWWLSTRREPELALARDWLMPEFLVFLAPLPLAAAAAGRPEFRRAGGLAIRFWMRGWLPMLCFALSAVPLLVLLEFALHMLPALLPPAAMLLRVFLGALMSASIHLWLFVSASLLLLRGGYLDPTPRNA